MRLKLIIIIIPLVILSLVGGYLLFQQPEEAQAVWYDESWAYRRPLTVSNSGAEVTNQWVKFDIDTATLITNGKMQSDCDDARFTNINGEALRYFLDSASGACNTSSTDLEVLIPTIYTGATSTVVYFYYGNPSAGPGTEAAAFTETEFTPSQTTYGAEEVGPGPIAYWKFDEGYGATANDYTLSNNDGAIPNSSEMATSTTGASGWRTEDMCLSGKCLKFDGSNDYVDVDSTQTTASSTTVGTWSAWVKPIDATPSGTEIFIAFGDTDAAAFIHTSILASGKLEARAKTTAATQWVLETDSASFNNNEWTHISVVHNGTEAALYVDGVAVAQTFTDSTDKTIWFSGVSTLDNGNIAAIYQNSAWSNYFNGFIDEVKIYPYARSAAQVREDYNSRGLAKGAAATLGSRELASLSDGLVGYWPLNESAANSCTGGTNDSCDYSGSGNDGAWVNQAAATTIAKFGRAVDFDGNADYINAGTVLGTSETAITVSAWVKLDSTGTSRHIVVDSGWAAENTWLLGILNTGAIEFRAQTSGDNIQAATSVGTIAAGTWYHIVGTLDLNGDAKARAYVNGVLSGTSTAGSGTFGTTNDIWVSRNDTNAWDGQIDEVRIYNRALSPKEVRDLYNWAPGPIGYWNFDEGTGTTANDRSTNGNNGTLTYMSTSTNGGWTQGRFGKALDFDGTDDWVEVSHDSAFNFGTGNFTIEFWVYRDAITAHPYMVHVQGNPPTDGWYIYEYNGSGGRYLTIYTEDDNAPQYITTTSNFLTANTWHHVAIAREGTGTDQTKIYVDGSEVATGTSSMDVDTTGSLEIAGSVVDPTNPFNGKLDEVRIYDYARTAKQIVEDMNAGHPAVGSPVGSALLHFSFDEAQGQVINDKGFGATTTANTVTRGADTTAEATDPTWKTSSECRIGGCLSFDGSADFVEADDTSSLDFGDTDDFTLAGWFNRDTLTTEDVILAKRNSTSTASDAGYVVFIEDTEELVFEVSDGTDTYRLTAANATSTVSSTGWNHFAAVWDQDATSTTEIYMNGKDSNATVVGTIELLGDLSNAVALRVGSESDGATYFDGLIDEVKIYNYALTQDEIKLEYNMGAALNFGAGSLEITSTAPIAEWLFNEGRDGQCAGGTNDVCDTSGNGNDGAKTNMATSTNAGWKPSGDCYSGKCLDFDGTDDYVSVDDNSIFEFGTGDFTISFWTKLDDLTGDRRFVAKENGLAGGRGPYTFTLQGGDIKLYMASGSGSWDIALAQVIKSSPSANQWYHIALTRNGTSIKGYADGVETLSFTSALSLYDHAEALTFGAGYISSARTRFFDGLIDEVKFYNYALTAAQVAYEYNRGKPIGHWKFDECQGSTAYDSSGDYSRQAGTRNNGTITLGATGSQDHAGTCANASTTAAWYNGRTGKMNASLSFDGTDDYVNVADNAVLDFATTTDFTITGWFNRDTATSDDVLVAKRNSLTTASDVGYIAYIDSAGDNLIFEVSDGTNEYSATSTFAFTSTGWYHFAVVWDDDSSAKIYINGEDDNASETGTISSVDTLANAVALRVASESDGASYFDGLIDDIRIYPYALNAEQVRKAMNDGAGIRFGPDTGQP